MSELTKAAEEATKTANNLLQKLFGPGAEAMGMNMAQGIRLRAVQNQIRGLKKLQAICDHEGFSMKQVNIKTVFPYLEGIALEEEPMLEEMWANLMANYLDSKLNLTQTVYPTVLKQLSTEEVKLFKETIDSLSIWASPERLNLENLQTVSLSEIANLERLGLIKENLDTNIAGMISQSYKASLGAVSYQPSQFGWDFYHACQRE